MGTRDTMEDAINNTFHTFHQQTMFPSHHHTSTSLKEAGILAVHVQHTTSQYIIDLIIAHSTSHFAVCHYTPSCDTSPHAYISRVDDTGSIPSYPCLMSVKRIRIPVATTFTSSSADNAPVTSTSSVTVPATMKSLDQETTSDG